MNSALASARRHPCRAVELVHAYSLLNFHQKEHLGRVIHCLLRIQEYLWHATCAQSRCLLKGLDLLQKGFGLHYCEPSLVYDLSSVHHFEPSYGHRHVQVHAGRFPTRPF